VRAVPVAEPDGSVREWVGLCVDIEDRMRVQEQMRNAAEAMATARDAAVQANRAKSAFLATMSHELRTPLNAILGYAEILQEDIRPLNQPQMLEDADHIISAGSHLLTVINDVLDLSRVEAGRMTLELRTFAVSELLRDLKHIRPMAERNHNELVFDCPSQIGTMHGDSNKLRQVLVNLLSNACKFTENGRVTLRCRRESENGNDWIYFAVIDTGIGIPKAYFPSLFQEFSQLDSSLARRYGGTGLGLAISKRFTDAMGGNITVESEVGKGSTFTVRVPTELPVSAKQPYVEI
jgi:signal transduction histidine kinase